MYLKTRRRAGQEMARSMQLLRRLSHTKLEKAWLGSSSIQASDSSLRLEREVRMHLLGENWMVALPPTRPAAESFRAAMNTLAHWEHSGFQTALNFIYNLFPFCFYSEAKKIKENF